MVDSIKTVLMNRDGLTESEAELEVKNAREEIMDLITEGESPMDFCEDRWGLEPDYLEELIF